MRIKVRDTGRVQILDLDGELKLGVGDTALRDTVKGLINTGHNNLVLNLRHVRWIDSSGMGEMVACRKRVAERGGELKLLMPSEKIYSLLVLVRFHEYFQIHHDESQAVVSFIV
ncbi:MAG TPA: STAS domain-containing protein [Candidatus Polarisedimenticolia bacterium]|nr:STAS domain-containing protein [Candidatus Polarisedimenticolia bacterium]